MDPKGGYGKGRIPPGGGVFVCVSKGVMLKEGIMKMGILQNGGKGGHGGT